MHAKYYLEIHTDSLNSYPTNLDVDIDDSDLVTLTLPNDQEFHRRELTIKIKDFLKLSKMIELQKEK